VCLQAHEQIRQNAIEISKNFIVPITDHRIAELTKGAGPWRVAFRRVLSAVDLDDETPFDAAEVDHERAERPLPLELEAAEPPPAQSGPHGLFRIGHSSSQSRSVRADRSHAAA
jgi:hypothetical protein